MEKKRQETDLRCSERPEKVLGYQCFRVSSQQARRPVWQDYSEKSMAMLVKSEVSYTLHIRHFLTHYTVYLTLFDTM